MRPSSLRVRVGHFGAYIDELGFVADGVFQLRKISFHPLACEQDQVRTLNLTDIPRRRLKIVRVDAWPDEWCYPNGRPADILAISVVIVESDATFSSAFAQTNQAKVTNSSRMTVSIVRLYYWRLHLLPKSRGRSCCRSESAGRDALIRPRPGRAPTLLEGENVDEV